MRLKIIVACIINTLVITSFPALAQQLKIEGTIYNKSTGTGLGYANLRAYNTLSGTSANIYGQYFFNLKPGKYTLIASCLGFTSDTLTISLQNNLSKIDFYLSPVPIRLPEVTILPGKNPALGIIERAIKRKEQRASRLDSYEYEAYTKGVIKSDNDVGAGANTSSVNLTVGSSKSSQKAMEIKAIFENESRGFYKKPGDYKELIIARKQTVNVPSTVNALTGGRLIQNFYSDDIKFFNRPMTGPLSKGALNYYYYRIDDTTAIDNKKVFKIYFETDNSEDPGFLGYIYIIDSTYDMIKIDADLNRAANLGGIFERVNIFQQFLPYIHGFYMPIDYRLYIRANVLSLAQIGFELSSILYNYKINENIDSDFFDKAILTVIPGADDKDSTYWKNIQTIPYSPEEFLAYRKIDSAASVPVNFWKQLSSSLLGNRINLNSNFSISGPLGLFHFNRVEGWALDFSAIADNLFDKRFKTEFNVSYGFSDKKPKQIFAADYYLGRYRTYKFSFTAFNRLNSLFAFSDVYNQFTSTMLALLAKYDFRDYYYSRGFYFQTDAEVLPILKLTAGFLDRLDISARKNSNYSFFAKNKTYNSNPPVYETKVNQLSFGFNLDFRKYIEDGYFRRRVSEGKSFVLIGGGLDISSKKLLSSSLDFFSYNANVQGTLNTFRFANLSFRVHGIYSDGPVPYQMQYALAGNISATGKNFTFRTVGISEIFGDRVATLNIEHNFRDELFRLSRIPILKDIELQLNTFFNIAWSEMSGKSRDIIPVQYTIIDKPLMEAGFSIGHVLFPLSLEFGWRLTHRENNSFVIGINTFIL